MSIRTLRTSPASSLAISPLGRRNRAAAADEDAGERALRAPEDAADDRADSSPGADLGRLTLDALALDGLRDGAAHRVGAPVDGQLIEHDGQAPLPLEAPCLVHRRDATAHHGPGRHDHAVSFAVVDDGRGLESFLDLCGLRAERLLQPHVELGADRDVRRPATRRRCRTRVFGLNTGDASLGRRRRRRCCRARRIAAGARADAFDPVAELRVFLPRHRLVLSQLDLEIDRVVAGIVELALELRGERLIARARLREIARRVVDGVLQTLDLALVTADCPAADVNAPATSTVASADQSIA